jgi:predicted GNAT family acetyltransferase
VLDVVNNRDRMRFEIDIDGVVAELVYRLHDGRLQLIHTGVPDELEGRGLGGQLVAGAIDYAVEHGLVVVPYCDFARGWLERHPEVASRVTIEWPTDLSP